MIHYLSSQMTVFLHIILSYYFILNCNGFNRPTNLYFVNKHINTRYSKFSLRSLSQEEIPILSALNEVVPILEDRYFFPGHCGGQYAPKILRQLYGSDIFHLDVPELEGLDNIHSPDGPLLRALQLAAQLFGAKKTWFLVNGSTSGILSAILASVQIHQLNLSKPQKDDHTTATTATPTTPTHTSKPTTTPASTKGINTVKRSVMLLGRDSHKASFDGLRLADCDGALLPCIHDEEFGVPLGVDMESIIEALETYGDSVSD